MKFEPYFLQCNRRCISHGGYWCTFSGVFHMNCFTWINGVGLPVHIDIRWISCEECHLILFHMFFTCIFTSLIGVGYTYPRVYIRHGSRGGCKPIPFCTKLFKKSPKLVKIAYAKKIWGLPNNSPPTPPPSIRPCFR